MAHYAQVIDGIVQQVIVIEQNVLNSGIVGDPRQWIKTSYNTRGGVHILGATPLRKNFAGVGFIYDNQLDAFYAPQPFASWVLDTDTCIWNPPKPYPTDGKKYVWDEITQNWFEFETIL